MIGYFGDVIFETSDSTYRTFRDLKRSAAASYADHKQSQKKPAREFTNPENQTITFTMQIKAGHGVVPRTMAEKVIGYCEDGTVCTFVLGGRKVGDGSWTIDSVDEDYKVVWNKGEIVSIELTVAATEYR